MFRNGTIKVLCVIVLAVESCTDEMDGARISRLQHLYNQHRHVSN